MKKVTVLIILGIILAFILINFSSAQDENQPTNFVQVGIYVLNIGKYELATGSFTADFYLSLKCSSQCSEDFEFMNGRASSFEKIINEPNEKFYRIQANLNSPVDLKKFPFDNQKLQIILEDKKRTTSE